MKKRNIILMLALALVAVLFAAVLVACTKYDPKHDIPGIKENAVMVIDRNQLNFAKDMEVDTVDVIAKSGCSLVDDEGNEVKITAEHLKNGLVVYDEFDVTAAGNNKQIRIAYKQAENFIVYNVVDYTVNFYLDEAKTDLWVTASASAALTDELNLSVWVDVSDYNYSTNESAREQNADKAIRFCGWFDSSSPVTGVRSLAFLSSGEKRVYDLHACFLNDEELAKLRLSYDGRGRRVFSGYKGEETDTVVIPEGVTYVDLASVFSGTVNFKTLFIPSTARMDLRLQSAIDTKSLQSFIVDDGNAYYASFDGALYDKELTKLYMMPADSETADFPESVETFEAYSCAYWNVKAFVLPESVQTLENFCFAYSRLARVEGWERVPNIMSGIFWMSNMPVMSENGAFYTDDGKGNYSLTALSDKSITQFTIKEGTAIIAGQAFSGCDKLQTIDLGNDLWYLGESAFSGCSSLTEVTLPSTVKAMGSSVFYECKALERVNGLEHVTFSDEEEKRYALPDSLFYGCTNLSFVTLPAQLTAVGDYAFAGCASLTSLVLPETVTSFGKYAFRECAFESLQIPEGLTEMGTGALAHTKLKTADFSACENLTVFPDRLFQQAEIESFTFPDHITAAANYQFYQAAKLTEITLNNVTSLGAYAFSYCTSLRTVHWGEKLKEIGSRSFGNCYALTEVVLPDSVETVAYAAFQRCDYLEKITLGKNLEVFGAYNFKEDGVTFNSGNPALFQVYNLKEFAVHEENGYFTAIDGILYSRYIDGQEIGGDGLMLVMVPAAYEKQTALELPENVKVIAPYALSYQKGVVSITLNNGLTNIGKGAFYTAYSIVSFTIPRTVTTIGANILLDCANAMEITLENGNSKYEQIDGAIYDGTTLILSSSTSASVTIREGTTNISDAVFMNNSAITSVTIPDEITSLGKKMFQGCVNLETVTIGSGLQSIDSTAFAFLPSLKSITVSGDNAYFKTNAEGTALYSKDGKKLLLVAAQNGWVDLSKVAAGVTEIGDYAFSHHATVKQVILPEGVKSVGAYAFYECRRLELFYACESLESIGERAFTFERSIDPSNPTEIRYCNTLTTVMLYGGLKKLGDFAFSGQYGISKLYLKMTEAEIEEFYKANKDSKNIAHIQKGVSNPDLANGYYNNDGKGIERYLYLATAPDRKIDGYNGWFYMNERGEPVIWETEQPKEN